MIIDADTHFIPLAVLEQVDTNLWRRKQAECPPTDINVCWQQYYDKIKDPSWPQCERVEDFVTLPREIRQEIHSLHTCDHIRVSDSLDWVLVSDPDDHWQGLDRLQSAGEHILKTDRQAINPHAVENIMSYHGDRDFALRYMQAYNDVMKQQCQTNPRFITSMWLALQHFKESMQELERQQDQGFFGVRLLEIQLWGYIPDVYPVFEFCAQRRLPLYVHGGTAFQSEDVPFHWHQPFEDATFNLINQTFPPMHRSRCEIRLERWLGMILSWIHSGLLDRLPDLRIVITERGTDWIARAREWSAKQGLRDPLPYLKNNFWFTAEPEEPGFVATAELLGWDRLLYATDWPHIDPPGLNRFQDLALMRSYLDDGVISPADYDRVTHGNFMRLYDRT